MAVEKRPRLRKGLLSNGLVCLFLAASLFLFIRNNELFAHGGRHLRHPAALVMLGVLGVPLVLTVLRLLRLLRQRD